MDCKNHLDCGFLPSNAILLPNESCYRLLSYCEIKGTEKQKKGQENVKLLHFIRHINKKVDKMGEIKKNNYNNYNYRVIYHNVYLYLLWK